MLGKIGLKHTICLNTALKKIILTADSLGPKDTFLYLKTSQAGL